MIRTLLYELYESIQLSYHLRYKAENFEFESTAK